MERRRGLTWLDAVMFGLLGFFVIATLGRALVGAVTLLDVDILTRSAPWQALHGQNSLTANICRGDTVDSIMPSLAEIRTRLLRGDFPAWSGSDVGGFPLAGVPNVGPFTPLALPYYVLPLWLAPAFVKLAEFAVAIGGMTLFLRRLRLSLAAGILAGIVFVTSGFMLSWTNWPQTRVAALIPLLFWATERLVQRQRTVDSLPLALVVACMLLGGFPAVTGMALYAAALYFLVRIAVLHRSQWRKSLRAALLAGLGLVLSAALSAFQLLPFVSQLATINLDRRAQTADLHSPLSSLITTMVPDAQGMCIGTTDYSPVNPIENLAFIGVAAVVLGIVAILMNARMMQSIQRGVVGFLAVAAVVTVILGWLGGPLLSLAQDFPVFSNNGVFRIRSVLGFILAALAGFGFDRLRSVVGDGDRDGDGDSDPRGQVGHPRTAVEPGHSQTDSRVGFVRFRPIWAVAVLAAIMIFGLWVLHSAITQARARGELRHFLAAGVVPAILFVTCLAAVVAVFSGRRWTRRAAIIVIALIVVGQSASTFRGSVTGNNPDNFYPVTSTHLFLQRHVGIDRFASNDYRMYPATAGYYGLRTPVGHQFATDTWKALLLAVDPRSARTVTFSRFNADVVNAGTVGHISILDQMAVRYFVAADSDIPGRKIDAPASSTSVTLTAGQHAQCVPAPGPLRAVTLGVASPLHSEGQSGVTVHAIVHTPRGDLTGARYFAGDPVSSKQLADLKEIPVAIPGEDLTPSDRVTADVWVTDVSGAVLLQGSGGVVSCGTVAPLKDGLKLVSSAGGAIVYQRLTSLPRIRWASRVLVQPDPAAQVASLKAGISPDTVLLSTAAPGASGESAKVRVTAGDGDTIAATVDAAGAGYLVVADSMQQPGWSATVDGKPVTLLPANHAMVAVPVPAGTHQVRLDYTVPGQRTGVLVTGGALMVCLGIGALWWWRRRVQPPTTAPPLVNPD